MNVTRSFKTACLVPLVVIFSAGCFSAQTPNSVAQPESWTGHVNPVLSKSIAGMHAFAAAPSNAMTITGVDPTCRADSSDAINKGIAAAAAAGRAAYLPPGCYAHNTVIIVDGAKLYGAGDSTELRATGEIKTYSIGGWNIGQDGMITLSLNGNRDFVAGSPADISGITGFNCTDPNGPNGSSVIIWESQAAFVRYKPKAGSCRAGSGGGAGTITSKNPLTAIVLKGSGAELHNVKATVLWAGGRTGLDQSSAVLNKASNFVVDQVHAIGSGGAPGFYCDGCNHGSETHDIVENSKADGMEHHGCAGFITNSDNRAVATGDDSFSVNSYANDSCVSHDITFTRDNSINSFNRGFDVDGGTNITIQGGSVVNAQRGCILIHSGGNYKTLRTDMVTVNGTTLDGCNTDGIWIAAAAGGGGSVSRITISNVSGREVGAQGIHIGEPGGSTTGVKVTDCTFQTNPAGAHSGGIFLAPASKQTDNVQIQGVKLTGFGQKCIGDPGGHAAGLNSVSMNCDGKSITDSHQAVRPNQ